MSRSIKLVLYPKQVRETRVELMKKGAAVAVDGS